MSVSRACFLSILFISIIGFDSPVVGQMTVGLNKDSLKLLITRAADDSVKVNNYIVLGQQYENSIPDSAIYYYQQANELSKKLNYPRGVIRYINNYTAVLNVQGKFDESLRLHEEALALCERYHYDDLRIKALMNIGVVYQYKQDYQAAADHYLKSLPVFEQAADDQSLSFLYGNLCGLYRNLNQPGKALQFAEQSVKFAEKSKDAYTRTRAYTNMANALKDVGRPAERLVFLQRTYDLGKQLNDLDIQETTLINLGDLARQTGTPDESIAYFKSALPLADSLADVYGRSLALHGIAFNLFRKKDYQAAESMALTALSFARENKQPESESNALILLSDIKIALGDLAASEQYRHAYDSVYATLINEDLMKNVQELETRYQVEKKQSQLLKQSLLLEQKDREASRQRSWLWILIASVAIMVFLLFWGIRYYRQRQLLNRKELEAMQAGQENLRLKSLLEGQQQERYRISQEMHDDMGSGLTSILFLTRTVQDQDEVIGKLRHTAQELIVKMNEIIWVMNHKQDTLDSLIAYIRLHTAEALDNAGIDYAFSAPDTFDPITLNQEVRRNLYLCTREAVHNVIKHAGATMVHIDISLDTALQILIKDNGHGMQQEPGRAGNGLRNMQRRMESIGGSFAVDSGPAGTIVILKVFLPV